MTIVRAPQAAAASHAARPSDSSSAPSFPLPGQPVGEAFERVKALAIQLFAAHPIEEHPFCLALAGNVFSPAVAADIALQIFHVVDCFPRFLAAVMVNLPDFRLRMPLVGNLYEEHGRLDPWHAHVQTYRSFLASLGVDEAAIQASEPCLPVVAYTRAVLDLCLHHPVAEALGALGAIEEIVARVSPIVNRFGRRRQLGADAAVHFSDHETLDLVHADEIYGLAATYHHGRHATEVERGLALGLYYHCRLYSDLLERHGLGHELER